MKRPACCWPALNTTGTIEIAAGDRPICVVLRNPQEIPVTIYLDDIADNSAAYNAHTKIIKNVMGEVDMNRSLAVLLLIFSKLVSAAPPHFTIQDLTAIAGHDIRIVGMNDRGQLIGRWNEGGTTHGVLYTDGVFESFGALIGDNRNYTPHAINNLGQVVLSDNSGYWLYSEHELTSLGISLSLSVAAMNDKGAIVGGGGILQEAWFYENGSVNLLREPPSQPISTDGPYIFAHTRATDINNAGVIVGILDGYNDCCGIEATFKYENGQMVNLGGADAPVRIVMNAGGHLALTRYYIDEPPCEYGVDTNFGYIFRTHQGPFASYPLGDGVYGWQCPSVEGINDHDVMVGAVRGTLTTVTSTGDETEVRLDYGLLYEAGDAFKLIAYLSGPHSYTNVTRASFINNQGWIIASADKADGSTAMLLLQPEGTVSMDLQPWDALNRVAPTSNKFIGVAIRGSSVAAGDAADFDASQIDTTSLKLGYGEAASTVGPWLVDKDNDGQLDALYGFQTEDTGTFCDDTSITLVGQTNTGDSFVANDFVQTTGCDGINCHP